jgi:hypothetical protein
VTFGSFYGLIALARLLPPPRDVRVLRVLGESMAVNRPFDPLLSAALNTLLALQERENA